MPKTPQPGECSFRVLYTYHVGKASEYERFAEAEMARVKAKFIRRNPQASPEWIDTQVSDDHAVKSFIGKQQFHTREATKYGLGMIVETMGHPFATKESITSLG